MYNEYKGLCIEARKENRSSTSSQLPMNGQALYQRQYSPKNTHVNDRTILTHGEVSLLVRFCGDEE
jgi:hypothetical protein